MTFTIHGRLPGLNEIIGAINHHRYRGATLKKKETDRCKWAIIAGQVPHFKSPVVLTFAWFEKDLRRDPDNLCAGAKFVLDALVEMGRIPNDTRHWIKGITHLFPDPDPKDARIEVAITEA